MKNFLTKFFLFVFITMTPLLAGATTVNVNYNVNNQSQGGCPSGVNSIADIFDLAVCILWKSVWPLLIAISVVVFIVGVIKYISNGDDSTKRAEGRNFMIYGLIGLFVMVSVWGLVGILQGTFGLNNTPFIPQLQEPQ